MLDAFKGAAALAVLAASAPAAAQQPAAQPSRWHLDGSTNRCVLTRRLEGTPAPATFILRSIPGSQRYELILAGAELGSSATGASVTRILLTPGEAHYEGEGRSVELPGALGRGALFGPFPGAFLGQVGASNTLRLAAGNGTEIGSWRIPAAASVAEAFAACEAEKQVEWGADPAAVEPGAVPARPVGDASNWLTPRDLGLAQALASAAFTAVFRLVVEPDGSVASCTLVESATNIAQPGDVCRMLVRRARYEPARDPRGTAVRSVATHIVSVRTNVEFRVIGG